MPDESESSNPDASSGYPRNPVHKRPGRVRRARKARKRVSKSGYSSEDFTTSRTSNSDMGVVFPPDLSTFGNSAMAPSDGPPPVGDAADLGFAAPGEGSPPPPPPGSPAEDVKFTAPTSTVEAAVTLTDDATQASTDVTVVGETPSSDPSTAPAWADPGTPTADDMQFAAERQADMDAMEAAEADTEKEQSRQRAVAHLLPGWGKPIYWLVGLVALLAVIGIVVPVETLGGSSAPATSRSTTGQSAPSSHAASSGPSGATTGGSPSQGPSSQGATSSGLPTSQSGASQPSAPEITAQPQAQTCTAGGSVSVMVSATGSPPPQVQWEKSVDGGKTWTTIMGATAPSWGQDCPSVPAQFRAIVFNSSGSVISNAVTVQS